MATNTPNYEIDPKDARLQGVETNKQAALTESNNTYDGMINESDKFYQAQIDASQQWAATQSQLQQQQTDFAIEQIEQQKAQATKDYTKEQSGAYVDWQKQSNQYGADAEQMAANGLTNTGYAESNQVAMFNAYQNRVATAKESYNLAIQNYNNKITEARLQNSVALAEIAYQSLQQELELGLQGFQYKNQLVTEKANKKTELESIYHNQYQDVLNQINTENALAEDVRQYNEGLAYKKEQDAQAQARWEKEIELEKARDAEAKRQWEAEVAYQKERDKVADSQWQKEYNLTASKYSNTSSGSSGGGSIKKSSSSSSKGGGGRSFSNTTSINKTSSNNTSSNSATMKSISNLGYGPISAAKLNALVESGEVVEYTENGVTKFKKAPKSTYKTAKEKVTYNKLKNLLN